MGLTPFKVGSIPFTPSTRALSGCSIKCQILLDSVEKQKAFKTRARDDKSIAGAKQNGDQHCRVLQSSAGEWVKFRANRNSSNTRSKLSKTRKPKKLAPVKDM